jgi:hypothetical protein
MPLRVHSYQPGQVVAWLSSCTHAFPSGFGSLLLAGKWGEMLPLHICRAIIVIVNLMADANDRSTPFE